MAMCEKCWGEAYFRSLYSGKSQADCYHDVLKEVEERGDICTPKEQAGQFWDDEKEIDTRELNRTTISDG